MTTPNVNRSVYEILRADRPQRMSNDLRDRLGYAVRVKSTRMEICRTQREIATAMGVAAPIISQIELGRYSPTRPVSDRLAAVLDVDANWLWTGDANNAG